MDIKEDKDRRQTERQTYIPTSRHLDIQKNMHKSEDLYIQADFQIDKQTDRWSDRQKDIKTDIKIDIQTSR